MTTEMHMAACPFCGTVPANAWPLMSIDGTWCTHHMHCGRCSADGPKCRSQSAAVEAWNNRAQDEVRAREETYA